MQAQAAPIVWDWILFWLMTGSSLLGLPPGERDPRLISAAPPKTIAYFEWAGQSAGIEGASGIDGFAADPEIRQLVEQFDAALAKRKAVIGDDEEFVLRAEWPQLARLIVKHPGCLFLGFEPRPANKPGPEDWINRLMGLHGGAILSVGDDADVVWVSLMRLFESTPDAKIQSDSSTQNIPLPIPGYQLVAHRDGQRILFALGDATLQRMIDGLSGKIPGLDTNPRFRDAFGRIHVPRVATLGWIDGQEALSTVNSLLGPAAVLARPILTLVGADAIDRAIKVSGVEDKIGRAHV